MTANTKPVFPIKPKCDPGQTLLTANTAKDGTGTMSTLYTAGADGGKVDGINIAYTGTSVQTTLRIFANNGSTNATAGNNTLIKNITVPANTLTGEINSSPDLYVPLINGGSLMLPAGYKIMACIGVTVAAALAVTATGGDLS